LKKYRWTLVIYTTIASFIVSLLLWYLLGGNDVFTFSLTFAVAIGTFIAGVLAGTYLDKKEKRSQKNQVVVMRKNKTIG